MEQAAQLVSEILIQLKEHCYPGITGTELDKLAGILIAAKGATSFNKGYHPTWATEPYPANICVSFGGIISHGVPTDVPFQTGDLVNIDMAIMKDGFCGDAALTVGIGKLEPKDARLLRYSEDAVFAYLSQVRAGVNTRELARYIEGWAAARGYNVNRRGCGHGIGKTMHELPKMYNTVEDDIHDYEDLKLGQIVCIEPILTYSKDRTGMKLGNGWTTVTFDRKPSAMFEVMARVTHYGYKLLTTHTKPRVKNVDNLRITP